jgi:hypothetical protein
MGDAIVFDMAADTPLTKNSIANFSRAPVAESFEYIRNKLRCHIIFINLIFSASILYYRDSG